MTKRSNYDVEDFLMDESFIEWVINDSEKEGVFWTAWIAAHPACLPAVTIAKKTLIALHIKRARPLTENEIDLIINSSQEKIRAEKNSKIKILSINYQAFVRIAAALILIFSIGYLFIKHFETTSHITANNTAVIMHQQVNKTKIAMLVKLADGSSVILKPNATITYPASFKGNNREVTLNGEAFFEVYKDASHPFLVHSGDWVTRVLGTSFTIKACNKTKEFKVIVNTGKVMVYKVADKIAHVVKNTEAPAKAIYITPNQEIIYNVGQKNITKEDLTQPLLLSADPSKELFTFHEAPLSKVVMNIEKAYNVNIIYDKKQIGGCPLTASISEQHLLEKLDLISKALNIKYLITDEGQIMLTGTGCNQYLIKN